MSTLCNLQLLFFRIDLEPCPIFEKKSTSHENNQHEYLKQYFLKGDFGHLLAKEFRTFSHQTRKHETKQTIAKIILDKSSLNHWT
jgi:hypothetical protein